MERTNSADELLNPKPKEVKPLQQPTCGRIVHFYRNDGAGPFPAIVHDNDTYPTLTVFTGSVGSATPAVEVVLSVPHESAKNEHMGYWKWPTIN